jgi:hypothetical protein
MSWTGKVPEPPKNPDKGLAVMTFRNYRIQATRSVEPITWPVRRPPPANRAQETFGQ